MWGVKVVVDKMLIASPKSERLPVNSIDADRRNLFIGAALAELWVHRELLYNMVSREIRIRYKQTLLGVLWSILQPLLLMIVFVLVFSLLARMPSDGAPYPIFAYVGLLPWTFFANSLSFAIPSLSNNENLIKKVYFPREIFPLAAVMAAAMDFLVACTIFGGMLVFYKIHLTANVLFVFPLLIIQLMFTIGVSLVFSSINAFYRDVKYALPLGIQLWMFATPVIYSASMVPQRIKPWYMALNPMAAIVDGYRRALIQGMEPRADYIALAFAVSLLLLALGYTFFKRCEQSFADVL
jgi:lipopolysaccharide transport system permease protein